MRRIARHLPHSHGEANGRSSRKRAQCEENYPQWQRHKNARARIYAQDQHTANNAGRHLGAGIAVSKKLQYRHIERAQHQRCHYNNLRS